MEVEIEANFEFKCEIDSDIWFCYSTPQSRLTYILEKSLLWCCGCYRVHGSVVFAVAVIQ